MIRLAETAAVVVAVVLAPVFVVMDAVTAAVAVLFAFFAPSADSVCTLWTPVHIATTVAVVVVVAEVVAIAVARADLALTSLSLIVGLFVVAALGASSSRASFLSSHVEN